MTSYLFILLGTALVNNVVFVRILGLCPFMGVSKKLETAIGMGLATMFVLTLACGSSYLIDTFLLKPFGLGYLSTLSFIVVIAATGRQARAHEADRAGAQPGLEKAPTRHRAAHHFVEMHCLGGVGRDVVLVRRTHQFSCHCRCSWLAHPRASLTA